MCNVIVCNVFEVKIEKIGRIDQSFQPRSTPCFNPYSESHSSIAMPQHHKSNFDLNQSDSI